MKRLTTVSLFVLFSHMAVAVDCTGVPSVVKMGEYGAQEAYVIVRINDLYFRMGKPIDNAVKARKNLAQSALIANHQIKLRLYNIGT